jgi:hypothetical protein
MVLRGIRSRSAFAWMLLLPLFLSTALHCRANTAFDNFHPCNHPSYQTGEDAAFFNEITPGVPWAAWGDLLNRHWSVSEVQQTELFDENAINKAIQLIASSDAWSFSADRNNSETYKPQTPATDAQAAAYDAARQFYSNGAWDTAVTRFDAVARDKDSPYRAAAAYSAARATINSGNLAEGMRRIHVLVRDPNFSEFHLAAYHLIGTRADQTMSVELIAARYAEIEHLLLTPPSLICRDSAVHNLTSNAEHDLFDFLDTAFPIDWEPANYSRRRALDTLATNDPFLDLIRAIAAPSPYVSNRGWLAVEAPTPHSRTSLRTQGRISLNTQDGTAITDHARLEWAETKNLLWGYALAQRTSDPRDLPALKVMLEQIADLPMTPAAIYASAALRRHFIWHAARLLLLDGRTDEAIAFVTQSWTPLSADSIGTPYGAWRPYGSFHPAQPGGEGQALLNGGIRLLLERFDLPGARRWAAGVLPDVRVDNELRPLLANGIDELLSGHVPGDRPDAAPPANHVGQFPRTVADLLPRSKIAALASHDGLSKSERRDLLASAWLRTYMLDGWKESLRLLPELRDAFPELATDIDNINGAWLSRSKRHLLTRMVLRLPGFDLRPSWVRVALPHETVYGRPGQRSYWSTGEDVFAIDGYNPSDGNWWCPVDTDQVKIDLAETFFVEAVGSYDLTYNDPLLPYRDYWHFDRQAMLRLADKLIAWHPLLKDADMSELAALAHIDNGPKFLSEKAIGWANGSNWLTRLLGFDADLPETLHLAVRATRYGCRRQGGHGVYSRAAYQELQTLFPKSDWTARTPYWFDTLYDRHHETINPAE